MRRASTPWGVELASIVFAVLAVGVLIILHEAGHYFVAKWSGMNVSRFSVGFGPPLWSRSHNGTEFMISAIPFGGYVQIDGMSPGDGTDPNAPNSYLNKPFGARFAAILAGPVANYILGFLLLFVFFALFNYEPLAPVRVVDVREGSAAAEAGLQPGDLLTGAAGVAYVTVDDFRASIGPDPIAFSVRREDKTLQLTVTPQLLGEGRYLIGITLEESGRRADPLGVVESVSRAGQATVSMSVQLVSALANIFSPNVQVSGPLGIISDLGERARKSWQDAIGDVARLSIMLGLFNLFPIPSLDGSRLLFLLLGAIRRKPIAPKFEQIVHVGGMLLLFGLLIVISLMDIKRIVAPLFGS